MKRLRDLLDSFTDEQILNRLIEIYPDQEKSRAGYAKVITKLRLTPSLSNPTVIHASKGDICGVEPNDDTRYAIEFTRWEEWLGMRVKSAYSNLDALCFCLWEMTFMGFGQAPIQRKISKLRKIVASIDKPDVPTESEGE